MRLSAGALLFLVALVVSSMDDMALAAAKKPSRGPPSSSRRSSSASRPRPPPGGSSSSRRPPTSKPKYADDEDYDEYEEDDEDVAAPGFDDDDEEEEVELDVEVDYEEFDDEDEEEDYRPRARPSKAKKGPRRGPPPSSKKRPPSRPSARGTGRPAGPQRKGGPPPRPGRGGPPPSRQGGRPGSRVVPYTRQPQPPSTFVRGIETLRSYMPDPTSVKEATMKSLSVARETTSSLSTNLYREMKGLTSSELEQVMLKATRPDDTPVKGKHAERLVGLTYQVSAQFEIYDAVLRKLWAKMAEKDWRTTIKALYILHRFSADGSPQHAQSLKVCLHVICIVVMLWIHVFPGDNCI